MAHLTLTPKENEFIRQALISVERRYTEQVNIDRSLINSPYTHDKSLYERMLVEDTERLVMAKSLYSKLMINFSFMKENDSDFYDEYSDNFGYVQHFSND